MAWGHPGPVVLRGLHPPTTPGSPRSQIHNLVWAGRDTKDHLVPPTAMGRGTRSTRPGCPKLHAGRSRPPESRTAAPAAPPAGHPPRGRASPQPRASGKGRTHRRGPGVRGPRPGPGGAPLPCPAPPGAAPSPRRLARDSGAVPGPHSHLVLVDRLHQLPPGVEVGALPEAGAPALQEAAGRLRHSPSARAPCSPRAGAPTAPDSRSRQPRAAGTAPPGTARPGPRDTRARRRLPPAPPSRGGGAGRARPRHRYRGERATSAPVPVMAPVTCARAGPLRSALRSSLRSRPCRRRRPAPR